MSAISRHVPQEPPSLQVHLLGVVDFDAAAALQERLVYEISGRNDGAGILLLYEQPPLITVGREGSRSQILAGQHELGACEIDVRWIARGGGAFVHAPGQLVASLLLPIERCGIPVSSFRAGVEESLVATCRDVRVPAKRVPSAPGVWSRGGQLGCFGASCKNGVTYHGAFLNVATDPGFLHLVESSPPGERLTSLEAQRGRRVSMATVRESLTRHLAEAFACDRVRVYTGHPLLKRTTRRVCLHA